MVVCAFAVAMPAEDTDAAAGDITYVSGVIDKDMTFSDGNKVVVDKDLTITNGAVLTIGDGAKFTVNEGVNVTINGLGSKIITNDDPETPDVDESDTQSIKATVQISAYADVDVNGTMVIGENGKLDMVEGVNEPTTKDFETGFMVSGTISFQNGTESDFTDAKSRIIIGSAGVMNVTSIGTKISQIGNTTITLLPGATFNMRGMATGDVTVEAVGQNYPYADDGKEFGLASSAVIKANDTNIETGKVTSAKISNIIFVASAESNTAYNADSRITVDVATLDISGVIQNNDVITTYSNDDTYQNADKENVDFASKIAISGTVTVGQTGTLTINSNTDVSGTVTVATGNSNAKVEGGSIGFGTDANITVTGTMSFDVESYTGTTESGKLVINGGNVTVTNATYTDLHLADFYGAYYTVTVNSVSTLNLVDLQVAIDAAAADSTIYEITVSGLNSSVRDENYKGAYAVEQDFTVPAGVQFVVNNVLLVPEEYTVTVPENTFATVNGAIVAQGTVIDNSLTLTLANDPTEKGVICEVRISTNDGATITYTSLKLALANSNAGDVIELAGNATIKENLEIPADRTVVIGGYTMSIDNGVVLTVNGVLNDEEGNLSTAAKTEDKTAGTVTVNNYMIISGDEEYSNTYNVSGVYFSAEIEGIDGQYFIASVPTFAGYSADIIAEASVKGTVTVNEDVTLTAGDRSSYVLSIDGTVKFTNVNIDGYQIEISENGLMTGTISANGNSVQLNGIKAVGDGNVTIANVIDEDEGTNELTISGTPAKTDKDGKVTTEDEKNVATLAATAGTATIAGTFDAKNLVSFGVSENTTIAVTGTLEVAKFGIEGTADVKDGGRIIATDIIVTGTLNIANQDNDNPTGGYVNANNVYIGIDDKFETQNAANVTGDAIDADVLYVGAQATLTSETDLTPVEFYVEDALWMTAYGDAQTQTVAIEAPVQNAVFLGWYDNEDEKQTIIEGNVITIGDCDRVDAKIKYDIYDITVIADNGVGTVAIDGNVLIKSSNAFIYNGYLAAGSHTISIDVKNGYSADNIVIQVNGQTISGNTFTLSGTPEAGESYVTVTITVSGTEATVQEPVVEEDGMGITDYLLIILVILVIVLAIFVALRMMRS